jgi:AcrR family transcriptional regulator
MTPSPDKDIQPILHAAMTLVATNGMKGLSLRPLADQLGTTVSALSHRFGLKDALIDALIDAASAEDGVFLDIWSGRIRDLEPRDGALIADLAGAILDDMAGPEALRTLFYCELLQGAASRPAIGTAIAGWQARRRTFWQMLAEPLGRPDLGDALHAFATDEAAHGLSLGDLAAYRWLRRLGLRRLCRGLIPAAPSPDMREFGVFHGALGDLLGDPGRYRAPPMSDLQTRAARHISALIIAEGADAVTHRAIAARAGLANSTLAYHFPRQEDLLKAGLNDIIARTQGVVDAAALPADEADYGLSSVEIARATFAVALAATRMPDLKAFAADMRRRRGENYRIRINQGAAGEPFDLLSAQALAIAGIGQIMLDTAHAPSPNALTFDLVERLQASALAIHQER